MISHSTFPWNLTYELFYKGNRLFSFFPTVIRFSGLLGIFDVFVLFDCLLFWQGIRKSMPLLICDLLWIFSDSFGLLRLVNTAVCRCSAIIESRLAIWRRTRAPGDNRKSAFFLYMYLKNLVYFYIGYRSITTKTSEQWLGNFWTTANGVSNHNFTWFIWSSPSNLSSLFYVVEIFVFSGLRQVQRMFDRVVFFAVHVTKISVRFLTSKEARLFQCRRSFSSVFFRRFNIMFRQHYVRTLISL